MAPYPLAWKLPDEGVWFVAEFHSPRLDLACTSRLCRRNRNCAQQRPQAMYKWLLRHRLR